MTLRTKTPEKIEKRFIYGQCACGIRLSRKDAKQCFKCYCFRRKESAKISVGDRFLAKIEKTPTCWLWKSGTTPHRQGVLSVRSGTRLASRISYKYFNGFIPKGKLVLHKCDNPLCVNPFHLELGNHHKNLVDAYKRGLRKMKAGGIYATC